MDASTEELRAAHDVLSEFYAEHLAGALDRMPEDRAVLGLFCELVLGADIGASVGDIGCGTGRPDPFLATRGLAPRGVDLSPEMIRVARRDQPGFEYEVADLRELPFEDASLAGIVCWYSVIHAAPGDVPAYFAEFGRAVKPGGHLLAAFFEAVNEPVTAYGHPVTTAYRWPADELAAVAGTAGFAEVGRMSREPAEGTRFRRGHLLMRRR